MKRRGNLTDPERGDLARMLGYLPELATLRRFADRIFWLFDTPKDAHQAGCRRAVLVRDPAFRAEPEPAEAMEQLEPAKFTKLMACLKNPVSRRVRTNNHVERTNRMFRFLEEVRYRWRRRRALVRFVGVGAGSGLECIDSGCGDEDRSTETKPERRATNPCPTTVTSGRMKSR